MLRRLDRVAKEIVRSALLRQVHRSIEIVLPAPRDISRNHDLTLVPTSHIQNLAKQYGIPFELLFRPSNTPLGTVAQVDQAEPLPGISTNEK